MVNIFLYSVYGQAGGTRHADDPVIAAHRNRWLDALLLDGPVSAVIALGSLAGTAYTTWADTRPAAAARLHLAPIRHPTYPESVSRTGSKTLAQATSELLANWNDQLPALHEHVQPDEPTPLRLYGDRWQADDLAPIPEADLPAGSPPWWRSLRSWASRTGSDAQAKRASITVTVPASERPWEPSPP